VAATEVIPESELTEDVAYTQMDLFTDYAALEREKEEQKAQAERERRLQTAMLSIKDKFGKNAVLRGISFTEGATARERNTQVGGHRGGEEDVVTALTDPDAADIPTDGTDGGDSL
jgi:DNA polymerase V